MKRFYPAIKHFREPGVIADVFDGETGFAQRLGGATGGNQFDSG
jgi:hypothetical protein